MGNVVDDAHLLVDRLARALVANGHVRAVDFQDVIPVWRAIRLISDRRAVSAEGTRPPGARYHSQNVVMELPRAREAVLLAVVDMMRRVRVACDGVEVRTAREDLEQTLTKLRAIGPHFQAQRRVHGDEDEPVLLHEGKLPLEPVQLRFGEAADIAAVTANIARISLAVALVLDVVEHDEQRSAVLEGVIGWAEIALEGLQRVRIGRCLEIDLMIARYVVPGDSDGADQRVVAREHRKVVEEDVAHGHAEGRIGSDELGDHIIANVVELALRLRLRVRKENCLEDLPLRPEDEREIDRVGQRTGGIDAKIARFHG